MKAVQVLTVKGKVLSHFVWTLFLIYDRVTNVAVLYQRYPLQCFIIQSQVSTSKHAWRKLFTRLTPYNRCISFEELGSISLNNAQLPQRLLKLYIQYFKRWQKTRQFNNISSTHPSGICPREVKPRTLNSAELPCATYPGLMGHSLMAWWLTWGYLWS